MIKKQWIRSKVRRAELEKRPGKKISKRGRAKDREHMVKSKG